MKTLFHAISLFLFALHISAYSSEFKNHQMNMSFNIESNNQDIPVMGFVSYSNEAKYNYTGTLLRNENTFKGSADLTVHYGKKACKFPIRFRKINLNIYGELEISADLPAFPIRGLSYGPCPEVIRSISTIKYLKPVDSLRKCVLFQNGSTYYVAFGSGNGERSNTFTSENEAIRFMNILRQESLCE